MERVGICGSDVHYWHRGYAGRFKMTSPLVLGHESSGQVVKTGAKVSNLAVGKSISTFQLNLNRTLFRDSEFAQQTKINDGALIHYFHHALRGV